MTLKHTEGPWEWRIAPGGYAVLVPESSKDALPYIIDDGSAGGEYMADIFPEEPDARLIASAPELLKACEMQLKLIEDMARFVGKMALQDYALFNEAPLAARQAIAKAKGDSWDG